MRRVCFCSLLIFLFLPGCNTDRIPETVHSDRHFIQDYSIKYYYPGTAELLCVASDRNGHIQVLGSEGLLHPDNGSFLYPGNLSKDNLYRPLADRKIAAMTLYDGQFVYCDSTAVLSNAWAGRLSSEHSLRNARYVEAGRDFIFMISDGMTLRLIKDSTKLWEGRLTADTVRKIIFDDKANTFYILGHHSLNSYKTGDAELKLLRNGKRMTCLTIFGDKLIIGTSGGYYETDKEYTESEPDSKLPCPELTVAEVIDNHLWFGSNRGAMMLRDDGKFNYYASERWLPSDSVTCISPGPDNTVLVLTKRGLAILSFDKITLYDKAMFFEKQVRERHIRNGFNATLSGMKKGDINSGSLEDSDNDGLWTGMYLAAEAFRYAETQSDEALKNVRESLDAMERLYTVTPVPGFPARSFERTGYKYDDPAWRRSADRGWDWKSTTSSDEAIGHIFAFGVVAELIQEPDIRNKAVCLIDTLMSHILKNNFYLIDWDGKPTRWGRWNPDYVNALPEMVGDRKLNSSNIIGMLQTAYRFTGKSKYRDAAFHLMKDHGYLENLMRPMKLIGEAREGHNELSRMLSGDWNHSDDEMYFLGYWGLYRYALNDTLKRKFREAIIDHWQAERPEKEGLWNIMTAMTGIPDFDLEEAAWYLREYPIDLIEWNMVNSNRKDITIADPGFRNQVTVEVLPPDELRIARHNANRFIPDGGNGGKSEMSAGDIWLLPYWMGRYLNVISGPVEN